MSKFYFYLLFITCFLLGLSKTIVMLTFLEKSQFNPAACSAAHAFDSNFMR